ncbi:hypothetical protein IFM89_032070 [Coptis chinensis]|uniref:Uncharacterized protein n=1 Tax=Coptis chinensis TaxID=261450 RepID=A0A835I522_9MAGN|nr:hypothetical protein IFM89_032070 [Coptis chinensis]
MPEDGNLFEFWWKCLLTADSYVTEELSMDSENLLESFWRSLITSDGSNGEMSTKRRFESVNEDSVLLNEGKMRRVSVKRTVPEGDEVLSVDGGVGNSNVQEGEILDARREYAPHVNAQLRDGAADQSEAEEGEIIEVHSANWFPEGSCQYSPKVNASEESVTSGSDYAVKVEIESAVLEADSSKQFPEDCVQVNAKLSGAGVTIGSDWKMKVLEENKLIKPDCAKQSGRSILSGVREVATSLPPDELLQSPSISLSETVKSLKFLDQVEEQEASKLKTSVYKSDIEGSEIVDNGSIYNSDIEEGEIIEVDYANRFHEGSGQYSPDVNARKESVTLGSDDGMKVNAESAIVEVDSAVQFEDGCGQFSPQVVAKLSGDIVSDTDIKVKAESELNKPDTTKQARRSRWSGVLEVARSLVPDESLQSLNTSISKTMNSLMFLGRVEDPEASGLKKAVELMVNLSGNYEPKTSELTNNLNDTELLDSMKDSNVPDSSGNLNNVDQPDKKGLPSSLALQLPVDSVVADALVQLKESDQIQSSFPPEDLEQSMHKDFLRRNRSARRDFPVGCGRRALLDSVDEYRKPVKCNQDTRVGEKSSGTSRLDQFDSQSKQKHIEKISFKRSRESTLSPTCIKSSYFSNKDKKMRMNSANLSNNKSVQRNVSGKSVYERCAVNKSKGEQIVKTSDSLTQETMNSTAEKHEFEAWKTSKVIIRKRNNEVGDYLSEHDEEDDSAVQRSGNTASNSISLTWDVNNNINQAGVNRNKVRETLRLFQIVFRKLLRVAEEGNGMGRRIDLKSATLLREKKKCVNTGNKILGIVPGVEVGDEFHYRVELAMIGLHHPYQNGIDYVHRRGKIVATSIVASGCYNDDMDSSDVLVYSGQGGCPGYGNKMPADQKLARGNLALKNSMDEGTPVRVIRGFKGNDSLDARMNMAGTLMYDGLYLVEKYWKEQGCYGNKVFMFQLRRIVGQPELAIKELKKSNRTSVRVGLCAKDISQGKEKMPIGAVNRIDDEKPPQFKYITRMMHPLHYKPTPLRGCDCTDGCLSLKCLCAVKNGGQIPFNYNGAIVETKPLVYECGRACKCPPSCYNRVSQHGIKFQLELFKTDSRGWGVRSLTSISSGSFICEYIGELLQDNEAEQRIGRDEYLFDIGHNYSDHAVSTELSKLIPLDLKSNSSCADVVDVSGFTIDAAQYGNIGRFLNHSCSPNIYAQNVLYDHDDKRMPHIMLFAAENISPLQELTYHYNMQFDQVYDSVGNIKKKKCYCGSSGCSGRMY